MLTPTLIEIPGKGITDLSAMAIDKAVNAYDANLHFGYNPSNQDYFVYVTMPRDFDSFYRIEGEPVYPILGFGHDIPPVDEVLNRLRSSDVRRRGQDIYRALMNHNDELRARQDDVAAGTVVEAAERIEQFARSLGLTEKYGRVSMHVPKTRKRR